MKLEPIASKDLGPVPLRTGNAQAGGNSARERAINALLGSQKSAPAPVANPTSVSVEESGALATSSSESVDSFEKAKQEAQKLNNEREKSSEAPTEETKEASEPLSSQYALLARKEKTLRQREDALKAKEAAIKAKEEASLAPKAPTNSFDESKYVSKEALKNDVFGVLTEMGMTYDELTEAALNGPKPKEIELMNEVKAMREELKALKGETESTKKSFEEQKTQSYQQAMAQIKNEAKALVNNNPDFETIKETDSLGDVVDLIEQTFKEDGILLTVDEAARQVEDYLIEEALKIARIKKIQQKLMPKAPEAAPIASEAKAANSQLKTLTNSVGTSKTLSPRERAILAMQGKLQK